MKRNGTKTTTSAVTTTSPEPAPEPRGRPGRRSVQDRQQAVLELLGGKATVDQLARRFGVRAETVEGWREEALAAMRAGLAHGGPSPRERDLARENAQLRDALTEAAIAQALLKRELEAARGAHPTRPGKSRR